MKRSLVLATFVFALLGCTQTDPGPLSYTVPCASGVCTGVGLAAVDAGLLLAQVDGFRLAACAPTGQTFLDGGTMNSYWGDSINNLVFRDQPLDQGPPAAGVACATWPDFRLSYLTAGSNRDYAYFAPSAVTVTGSSSSNMTVYLYPHMAH